MPGQPRRVFLSHTGEFAKHPADKSFIDAALDAIARAGEAPSDMRYFTARDTKPADYCKQQVKACQVYVGIIGLRYGSPVRDRPQVSYTELEFETAREAGLKTYVFLLDPNALVPAAMFTDPRNWDRQEAFRRRVADSGVTTAGFSTADQLGLLVFQALRDSQPPERGSSPPATPRLKKWKKPKYPKDPYPLLRPYEHPDLFAGREDDLEELETLLGNAEPVLALYSTSGAGKSSLLRAGLLPRLRENGWPTSYTAYPRDHSLAKRLASGLLKWEDEPHFPDDPPDEFVAALRAARALSTRPAILILDQFEDVIEPSADEAKERIARLLTSTIEEDCPCRWVLSYRHEFHGLVEDWLQEAFRQAGLTWRGRFQTYPLRPLGDPHSLEKCTETFLSAIEAPLKIPAEERIYKLSITDGAARRLAGAFAETRRRRPKAPLLPELQVVLHHLLKKSGGSEIGVPEDPNELIAGALRDHLRRAVEEVGESHQRRAQVLLVLRELATDDRKRGEGLPVAQLETAIGADILDKLCNDYRVLYREPRDGRAFYLLSHDRIAEAVSEEIEDPAIQEWLDEKVVALRSLVHRMADLLEVDREKATSLSPKDFRGITDHVQALLLDERLQRWWKECLAHNRGRIEGLKRNFAQTDSPGPALVALSELTDLGLKQAELGALLTTRSDFARLFEQGPAGVLEHGRNRAILAAATAYAPLLPARIKDGLDDCAAELGAILWALDYGPSRDADLGVVQPARELRMALVNSLRERFSSLPEIAEDEWAFIEGGSFQMGSDASDARDDERPVHRVEIDSFRLLKHQVTNLEFSRLFDRWQEEAEREPRHPAVNLDWYRAYVFAAWLGGRLPTEAEWEFAARSRGKQQRYPWGNDVDDIVERAVVLEGRHKRPLPVGSKSKGNTEQGVSDMAGNVWEWVGDWYAPYSLELQRNPWGPFSSPGGGRVFRGGSFLGPAARARVSSRGRGIPWFWLDILGSRVVVPVPPQPSKRDH